MLAGRLSVFSNGRTRSDHADHRLYGDLNAGVEENDAVFHRETAAVTAFHLIHAFAGAHTHHARFFRLYGDGLDLRRVARFSSFNVQRAGDGVVALHVKLRKLLAVMVDLLVIAVAAVKTDDLP